MILDAEFLCPRLERLPIRLAFVTLHAGMRLAGDDEDSLGMHLRDFRQCLDDVLVALAARNEAEAEDHLAADEAELVLVIRGVEERHVRDAMRDDGDATRRNPIGTAEDALRPLAHDDHPIRGGGDLAGHFALIGIGLLQDGVERGDDRNPQILKQPDDIGAGLAAIDAELMLQRDGVDLVHVQEIDGAAVVGNDLLADLELDLGRIVVTFRDVVHGKRPELGFRRFFLHGGEQIRRKRRNSAPARDVRSNDSDTRRGIQNSLWRHDLGPSPRAPTRPGRAWFPAGRCTAQTGSGSWLTSAAGIGPSAAHEPAPFHRR